MAGLACSLALHGAVVALVLLLGLYGPPPAPQEEAIPVDLVALGGETASPPREQAAKLPEQPSRTPAQTLPSPPAPVVQQAPPPVPPDAAKPREGPKPDPLADVVPERKPPPPVTDYSSRATAVRQPARPAPTPFHPRPDSAGPPAEVATTGNGSDTQLQATYSVKDYLRAQIERQWNFDVDALGPADIRVAIHLLVNPDGSVRSAEIVDEPRYDSDPRYRALAISARNAALVAAPLRFPPAAYAAVRDVTLEFDPKDALR